MPFRAGDRRLVLPLIALLLALAAGGIWLLRAPDPVVHLSGRSARPAIGAVHFGGPDKPAGALSTLLLNRIRAMPAGSSIDWATYYFRDRDLATALIAASDRGVHVRLCVDGDPRLDDANDAALAILRAHGLNGGLVVRQALPFPFDEVTGRLHLKIYAFSAPTPVAFVGSFNPSGDEDTDEATISEIGDQDRGHNLLVEVVDPALVATLVQHVGDLSEAGGSMSRFAASDNERFSTRDTDLYFYPRLRPYIVEAAVDAAGRGDRLWGAISHLKGAMVDRLAAAARRGAVVDLVVHDTERRVPEAEVRTLLAAGAAVRRYRDPQHLPMHAKFLVIERRGRIDSYFGSLNFNRNSRWLNDEVLLRSGDPALARTLLARFAAIERDVDRQRPVAIRD